MSSRIIRLSCGCTVDRLQPAYFAKMCEPCQAHFSALHARAAAEHSARAGAGTDQRSRDTVMVRS